MGRITNYEWADMIVLIAERDGNDGARDLALQAKWDFDFAMCADARGERSRAWSKRSTGRRALNKAREMLSLA